MKKLLYILIFILLSMRLFAQDYYVSKSGSDTNSGSAPGPSQSFLTIGRAASVMTAGDTCHIMQGVYRESIVPANSGSASMPVRFTSYGADSVTITGADALSGTWINYSGNIYYTDTPLAFTQLFCNSVMMNEARWPNLANSGAPVYAPRATAEAGTNSSSLYDSHLPAGSWNGAYVHIVPGYEWSSYTRQITNYLPGGHFDFSSAIPGDSDTNFIPQAGNRYYLFGCLAALDSEGEWYLDTSAHRLYFYAPGGGSPANNVEVKQRYYSFDLSARSNIKIDGLTLFGSAVNMTDSTYCTVDNCHAFYVDHFRESSRYDDMGGRHNYMSGAYNTWSNSEIGFSAGCGISIQGRNNSLINCYVHDMGYMADYSSGVLIQGTDSEPTFGHLISGNTITRSGRFTLFYPDSTNCLITLNDVSEGSLLTKDCGAIYCFGPGTQYNEISYNRVHDMPSSLGSGIYLDNGTNNALVHHNLIYNVSQSGIVLNTPSQNNRIFNNTIRNAAVSTFGYWGSWSFGFGDPEDQSGTQVMNNNADMSTASFASKYPPSVSYNGLYAVDSNYYPLVSDNGVVIPGITDGYLGTAPDIGAYEAGVSAPSYGYKTVTPTWTLGGATATYTNTGTGTATPTITPTLIPGTMIDDVEDGDLINSVGASWFSFNDNASGGVSFVSTPFVVSPGAHNSTYAIKVTGTVTLASYQTPFCVLACPLASGSSFRDLSSCFGIRFYANGDNRYWNIRIVADSSVGTGYNEYKKTIYLNSGWQMVQIPFTDFTQATGWGTQVPLGSALTKASRLDFYSAQYPASGGSFVFSLSVDDVSIYGCGMATPTNTPSLTPVIPGLMISDCDNNTKANNWGGLWYTYDDRASPNNGVSTVWPNNNFVMSSPGYNSTGYCARVTGTVSHMSSYAYPFVTMGTSFGLPSMDLTGCSGLKVWVKGDSRTYTIKMVNAASLDVGYNYYKLNFNPPSSWSQMNVPFSSLTQETTWGTQVAKNQALGIAYAIEFQTIDVPAPGNAWNVDLWVDNIELYGCTNIPPLTPSCTVTRTFTATPTVTVTPTITVTLTATVTLTITFIPTITVTPTITGTATFRQTYTLTVTPSVTPTLTLAPAFYKPSGTLKNAYVYPSLFRSGSSQNGIWFLGLTKDTIINIYNTKGELVLHVKAGAANGKYFWKIENVRKSQSISSGVYIYTLTNDKKEIKSGKLAVIR